MNSRTSKCPSELTTISWLRHGNKGVCDAGPDVGTHNDWNSWSHTDNCYDEQTDHLKQQIRDKYFNGNIYDTL